MRQLAVLLCLGENRGPIRAVRLQVKRGREHGQGCTVHGRMGGHASKSTAPQPTHGLWQSIRTSWSAKTHLTGSRWRMRRCRHVNSQPATDKSRYSNKVADRPDRQSMAEEKMPSTSFFSSSSFKSRPCICSSERPSQLQVLRGATCMTSAPASFCCPHAGPALMKVKTGAPLFKPAVPSASISRVCMLRERVHLLFAEVEHIAGLHSRGVPTQNKTS